MVAALHEPLMTRGASRRPGLKAFPRWAKQKDPPVRQPRQCRNITADLADDTAARMNATGSSRATDEVVE